MNVINASVEHFVLMSHKGKRITVFFPDGPSAFDPVGECWGTARVYEIVADAFTSTQELVPIGPAIRVTTKDMEQRFGEKLNEKA